MLVIGDSLKVNKRNERKPAESELVSRLSVQWEYAGARRIHHVLGSDASMLEGAEPIPEYDVSPEGIAGDGEIPQWPERIHSAADSVLLFDMGLKRRTFVPECDGKLYLFLHDANAALIQEVSDKKHVVPVIAMEALRSMGSPISRRISWERTALDFRRDFAYGISNALLGGYDEWIVLLECEGCITKQGDSIVLYYYPDRMEGDHGGFQEKVSGVREAIAAGVAKAVRSGFLSDLSQMFQYTKYESRPLARQDVPDITHVKASERWSIIEEICEDDETDIDELAREIVIYGEDALLKKAPYCKFNALLTIDRHEIESYRAIVNLIAEYVTSSDSRPLCISVFGFPGSGKSFGIKQIAKKLGNFQTYTFNISQFTSLRELEHAFQEIRDASIRGGTIPLVFFDEFDSSFEGEALGWLKYFLAPMQDGTFMENGRERPIGRAVFVFAGGTSTSFAQFTNQNVIEFKKVKGPDFISRLKGFINIQGPNRTSPHDRLFILRRAMLLRSMIVRGAGHLVDSDGRVQIDGDLLHALLTTKQYLHGARSMEFIIAMSPLHQAAQWTPSLLPPMEQMNIHVDAADFYNQLYLLSMCDVLAKNSHNRYLAEARKHKLDISPQVNRTWEQLDETFKRSNREQVRFNLERFRDSNIGTRPITHSAAEFKFKPDDIESFARLEHDRWCRERRKDGWTYGEKRDNDKKLHPCLVEWDRLTEEEKRKDADVIEKIPALLHDIGFELYYTS